MPVDNIMRVRKDDSISFDLISWIRGLIKNRTISKVSTTMTCAVKRLEGWLILLVYAQNRTPNPTATSEKTAPVAKKDQVPIATRDNALIKFA